MRQPFGNCCRDGYAAVIQSVSSELTLSRRLKRVFVVAQLYEAEWTLWQFTAYFVSDKGTDANRFVMAKKTHPIWRFKEN